MSHKYRNYLQLKYLRLLLYPRPKVPEGYQKRKSVSTQAGLLRSHFQTQKSPYNNGQNQLSNSCPSLIRKKPWFFVSLWDKQKTYPTAQIFVSFAIMSEIPLGFLSTLEMPSISNESGALDPATFELKKRPCNTAMAWDDYSPK